MTYDDGTVVEMSSTHPTAAGRFFKDLDVNSHGVREITRIPYDHDRTFNILPASDSGGHKATRSALAAPDPLTDEESSRFDDCCSAVQFGDSVKDLHVSRRRRSLRLFVTTETLEVAMANAASTGCRLLSISGRVSMG